MKFSYSRRPLQILWHALYLWHAFYFRTEGGGYEIYENSMHTKYSGLTVYLKPERLSSNGFFCLKPSQKYVLAQVKKWPKTQIKGSCRSLWWIKTIQLLWGFECWLLWRLFTYSQALTCHWQIVRGTSRGVRPANADGGLTEWRCRVAWRGYPAVSSRPWQQHTLRDIRVDWRHCEIGERQGFIPAVDVHHGAVHRRQCPEPHTSPHVQHVPRLCCRLHYCIHDSDLLISGCNNFYQLHAINTARSLRVSERQCSVADVYGVRTVLLADHFSIFAAGWMKREREREKQTSETNKKKKRGKSERFSWAEEQLQNKKKSITKATFCHTVIWIKLWTQERNSSP